MENKEQENKSHLYISYWGEKIRQSRLGIGNSNFDLMNFMKSEVEKCYVSPDYPYFIFLSMLFRIRICLDVFWIITYKTMRGKSKQSLKNTKYHQPA